MYWPRMPSKNIPDCITLVSFAITLNHRRTFLLYINTLACVKVAKVLDYNMVYSQGLPNDKKVG